MIAKLRTVARDRNRLGILIGGPVGVATVESQRPAGLEDVMGQQSANTGRSTLWLVCRKADAQNLR